ncbi:DUF2969 domain-containing protein [Enterococcus sp. LJL99]
MSKKNKEIEVRIEEETKKVNGQNVVVSKLIIGKKEIGCVIPEAEKMIVEIDGRKEATVKSLDEAVEYIIRQWNLND